MDAGDGDSSGGSDSEPSEDNLSPDKANDIIPLTEKNVLDKWEALSQYKSEINNFPHPRSKDGIITLAKYRGLQSGSHFAEGFKLVRDFSL